MPQVLEAAASAASSAAESEGEMRTVLDDSRLSTSSPSLARTSGVHAAGLADSPTRSKRNARLPRRMTSPWASSCSAVVTPLTSTRLRLSRSLITKRPLSRQISACVRDSVASITRISHSCARPMTMRAASGMRLPASSPSRGTRYASGTCSIGRKMISSQCGHRRAAPG